MTAGIRELEKAGADISIVLRELLAELVGPLQAPLAKPTMFRRVPLPNGLTNDHLRQAMDYTTTMIAAMNRDLVAGSGLPLIEYIQANNFSGIVSNILTDALSKFSPFKHNHDQKYPDLKDASGVGLEMKAANRAGKGGESHNAHSGWHLIACFDQLKDGNIRFTNIEIAELVSHQQEPDGDWHYCGSRTNATGSRRTETYYTTDRGTWKLRDGSAYLDTELVNHRTWRRDNKGIKLWKIHGLVVPEHSPFFDDEE